MIQLKRTAKIFLLIIAFLGWFALLAQFYILAKSRNISLGEVIIFYLSFFTILTNLTVAICTTLILIKSGNFFTKPSTITAIAVYIFIVGAVYNLILRPLWNPVGLQKLVDELLHSVIPGMFLIFWLMFVPKNNLK
jgi:hypothetical protein